MAFAIGRGDGAPERDHGEQRDEAEQRSRQVIEAIRQVALDPDADDVQVFFHPREESSGWRAKGEWKFICVRMAFPFSYAQ
jgi:hypothetical protein